MGRFNYLIVIEVYTQVNFMMLRSSAFSPMTSTGPSPQFAGPRRNLAAAGAAATLLLTGGCGSYAEYKGNVKQSLLLQEKLQRRSFVQPIKLALMGRVRQKLTQNVKLQGSQCRIDRICIKNRNRKEQKD